MANFYKNRDAKKLLKGDFSTFINLFILQVILIVKCKVKLIVGGTTFKIYI